MCVVRNVYGVVDAQKGLTIHVHVVVVVTYVVCLEKLSGENVLF